MNNQRPNPLASERPVGRDGKHNNYHGEAFANSQAMLEKAYANGYNALITMHPPQLAKQPDVVQALAGNAVNMASQSQFEAPARNQGNHQPPLTGVADVDLIRDRIKEIQNA